MPFSTSFDGANNTVVDAAYGFTPAYYPANNFARLNGAGALKALNRGSANPAWHVRLEDTPDHFVEVVVGAGGLTGGGSSAKILLLRAPSSGFGGWCLYYHQGYEILFLQRGGSNEANVGIALSAGATIRAEAEGNQIRVYVNGTLRITHTIPVPNSDSYVGFCATADADTDDVLRSWASGSLAGDVDEPVITDVDFFATGPSTATGLFTSNEAGTADIVVFLASQGDPSDAQVAAGDDENDDAAIIFVNNFTMVAGVNELDFTGLTPGTGYKMKVVASDEVPNTAVGVTSSAGTTPSVSVSVLLYESDGVTPAASRTGLRWGWWDTVTPDFANPADASGTTGATDAGGTFTTELVGSLLSEGDAGTLLVYKTDGTVASLTTLAFCGALNTVG